MSFTLSQLGMVVRWQKIITRHSVSDFQKDINSNEEDHHFKGMRYKQLINLVGAIASGIVMTIFAVTKFTSGAWVTVFLIPAMVWAFFRIHGHYQNVEKFLRLPWQKVDLKSHNRMKTLILIDDVNTGTLRMVRFAKTLGHPWSAIHVNFDENRADAVQTKWNELIGESELKFLYSPYRLLLEPITDFINTLKKEEPDTIIHIITGELVVRSTFGPLLHSKNARGLYDELRKIEKVIVTSVPYHLERRKKERN
jgi:hypothetical protein